VGFRNPIVGAGGALVRPAIKSPNYVPGVSGWQIGRDGTAELNDAIIRGLLIAAAFQTAASGERIEINVDDSGAIVMYDASDDEVLRIDPTGLESFSGSGPYALSVGNGLINFESGTFLTPLVQMFNDAANVYLNTQLAGGVAFSSTAAAWAPVLPGGTTLDTRHTVGSGGAAAPFNTNWLTSSTFNGSTNWAPLYYGRDALDYVAVQGAFKANTTAPGASVFQLPAGYRPAQQWPVLVERKSTTTTPATSMFFGAVSTAGNLNIMTQTGGGIAASDEFLVWGHFPRGVLA
jgi:hypothetical protein